MTALDRLKEVSDERLAICWLGNLSWVLRADGVTIAFDLDLESERRLKPSPIPTEALGAELDIQIITHDHGDHFDGTTSRKLAEQSDCLFVVPANCLESARSYGIPEHRIHVARPFEPFRIEGLAMEPKRAFHGHTEDSVYRGANEQDCGYVFGMGGKRIYQPGDTVLLQEHLEDFDDVAVLFVSPTIHNTHLDDSERMIRAIEPEYVFPQHFGTYEVTNQNEYWTRGFPDELKEQLSPEFQAQYHKLEIGEVFAIE
jgi:L-ascorbate metabolism protein UlaG (beta-lactamase superfamily)